MSLNQEVEVSTDREVLTADHNDIVRLPWFSQQKGHQGAWYMKDEPNFPKFQSRRGRALYEIMGTLPFIEGESDIWSRLLVGKMITTEDEYTAKRFKKIIAKKARRAERDMNNTESVEEHHSTGVLPLDGGSGAGGGTNPWPERFFYCKPSVLKIEETPQTSGILRLPAEVRVMIYEAALEPEQNLGKSWVAENKDWWERSGVPLIFTCKQIYREALPIALKTYTFPDKKLPERQDIWLLWPGKSTPWEVNWKPIPQSRLFISINKWHIIVDVHQHGDPRIFRARAIWLEYQRTVDEIEREIEREMQRQREEAMSEGEREEKREEEQMMRNGGKEWRVLRARQECLTDDDSDYY